MDDHHAAPNVRVNGALQLGTLPRGNAHARLHLEGSGYRLTLLFWKELVSSGLAIPYLGLQGFNLPVDPAEATSVVYMSTCQLLS